MGGAVPVWVFTDLDKGEVTRSSFNDGVFLERCRCQMSLDQDLGLERFAMLELEIDEDKLKWGLTHNAMAD
ncbi:hypothetical protein ASU35_10245 [Acetivibrio ethanolgignens]|uniref:Uncharacterized protein n=1 Tax=Acetivibrio ethanolgignens TaxID=290052 RepID=A0A0V8QEV1_9FIRM|nr:hypothetical protein ASU35_10245 [Acetivibrio ethanolgignens]